MKTLYSKDNEIFEYDTLGDLLDSLEGETDFVIGMEYYSTGVVVEDLTKYLRADDVLQLADDYLYDNIPNEDSWEIFLSATTEAKQELDNFLKEWTQKHLSKNEVYKIVGKSTKHIIAEDDLWDGI